MSRLRRGLAALLVTVLGLLAAVTVETVDPTSASAASTNTLLLYDSTGPYAYLGEQYGMMAANLASHFGTVTARPVTTYTAGEMAGYTAVIYLGATYDEPLPNAFLDDVISGTTPVVWLWSNIWQLTARQFASTGKYWVHERGWEWIGYEYNSIPSVTYKGRTLSRYAASEGGVMNIQIADPAKATVLATANRADGSTFPWATRSGNLTYIGEMPFSYIAESDRYLAFADILFDALAPNTPERHRALVRIEDVSPVSDPAELRTVADALAAEGVPFSVTVIPEYRDPTGNYNGGVAETVTLAQAPLVVAALNYMVSKGGTLIMHGWTHQYDGLNNPYNGVSGDDTEFFRLIEDPVTDNVVFFGPMPDDAQSAHQTRLNNGLAGFASVGLARPTIFTPPHYAASPNAYSAIRSSFTARYDRGLYFTNQLTGGTPDTSRFVGQFFPYPVTDVQGMRVVPENLGNEEPDAFNNNPPRGPQTIIDSAATNLVVRDGFASFFWHPYLVSDSRVGIAHLTQIVRGIKALGYTFVSSGSIATAATPAS